MSMVKPSVQVSKNYEQRLDDMRQRLVYLRGAGQLKGAPGWSEWKGFVERLVSMLAREEQSLLDDCADNGEYERIKDSRPPREAWQVVADARAARRARRFVEMVLTAVEKNEESVTALAEDIRALEKKRDDHQKELDDAGEVSYAE